MNYNDYEIFLKLILHSPQYLGHLAMEIQVLDEINITEKLIKNKGIGSDFLSLSNEITTALKNGRGKITETEK